jgi:spore germination cell wall hydrolase CwlJ-like protein
MIERIIVSFFLLLLTLPIIHSVNQSLTQPVIVQQAETEIKNPVNLKHLKCLAAGIYYEANGEPLVGQIAVARVIMNRVLHGFAKDPCAVVYQSTTKVNDDGEKIKLCQFSWVCDGKMMPSESNPNFIKAVSIARQILEEDKWSDIIPNNTFFFHNLSVAPRWTYNKVVTIGNHIFYSKGREKIIDKQPSDK